MRLNQKKIEEVVISILGEPGLALVKELYGKENVNEFDLAHRTKKDIKVIRKMLYFLYNHHLVGFTRKKDKQKGWYIYYWTLQLDSIMFHYLKRRREMLAELKSTLESGQKELFYICSKNCIKLNFDQALDFEFHCPECGELIMPDAGKGLESIPQRIKELEEELASAGIEEKRRPSKARKVKVTSKKKIVKKVKAKIKPKKKKK